MNILTNFTAIFNSLSPINRWYFILGTFACLSLFSIVAASILTVLTYNL